MLVAASRRATFPASQVYSKVTVEPSGTGLVRMSPKAYRRSMAASVMVTETCFNEVCVHATAFIRGFAGAAISLATLSEVNPSLPHAPAIVSSALDKVRRPHCIESSLCQTSAIGSPIASRLVPNWARCRSIGDCTISLAFWHLSRP